MIGSRSLSLILAPSLQLVFLTKTRWIESFPARVLQVLRRDFRISLSVRLLMLQRLGDEEERLLRQTLCQPDNALSNWCLSKRVLHGSLPAHDPSLIFKDLF